MIERRILAKLLELEDLPTLPDVMAYILEIVEDDKSSAGDLTEILERDHAISARVLRLANSAFYGLRYEVESIRRAVVVVGFEAVRELSLATSAFDSLSRHKQFALDPEDFWLHSLGTAKASQMICREHFPDLSAGACFTAGLLHDIGKYLLALVLKGEYRDVVELARVSQRLLYDIESEILSTTHSEVGYWIANKWHFPKLFTDVILHLYRLKSYKGQYRTEVALVSLADKLSRSAGFGHAGDPVADTLLDRTDVEVLGLERAQVDAVLAALEEQRAEASQFLGILIANP